MNVQSAQVAFFAAYDHLTAISPAAPYALLTVLVFLAIYSVRRFAPKQWLYIEDKLGDNRIAQALPATLAGALVSALASGGDVGQSWKGALAGALAPLLHHALKSYDGADAVLDAAQAKLLSPATAQPGAVKAAAEAAVVANLPAIVAAVEKTTQAIPVATQAGVPAVVVPAFAPAPSAPASDGSVDVVVPPVGQ